LPRGKLQTPDRRYGQYQDVKVGQHIDDPRDDGEGPLSSVELCLSAGTGNAQSFGFRIEPDAGEIEQCLKGYPGVDQISHRLVATEKTVVEQQQR